MFTTRPLPDYRRRLPGQVLLYMGGYQQTEAERQLLESEHPGITQAFQDWTFQSSWDPKIYSPEVVLLRGLDLEKFHILVFADQWSALDEKVRENRDSPMVPGLGRLAVVGRMGNKHDNMAGIDVLRVWFQASLTHTLTHYYEGAE